MERNEGEMERNVIRPAKWSEMEYMTGEMERNGIMTGEMERKGIRLAKWNTK
jgi:hypothetical protein